MQMAISNMLALLCWQGYPFYRNFGSRDLTWLLIGVLLAAAAMWIYSRRRRRLF
jgi:LPXTG-motif cell wall-anchored protein